MLLCTFAVRRDARRLVCLRGAVLIVWIEMFYLGCARIPLSAQAVVLIVFTQEPPSHPSCSWRVVSHARSSFAQTRECVPSFTIEAHSSQYRFKSILRCVSHCTLDLSTLRFLTELPQRLKQAMRVKPKLMTSLFSRLILWRVHRNLIMKDSNLPSNLPSITHYSRYASIFILQSESRCTLRRAHTHTYIDIS